MFRMVVGWQRERIIRDIEAFCARVSLSEREFSEMAVSMNFMSRLRRKGQASMDSLEAAAAFITAHAATTPQEMRALVKDHRAQRKMAA